MSGRVSAATTAAIVQWPDTRLRTPAELVTPEEVETDEFLAKTLALREMLMRFGGFGIAAPQVGWSRQVIVMVHPNQLAAFGAQRGEVGRWDFDLVALVNPTIVARRGGAMPRAETCLSFYGAGAESVSGHDDIDVECPDTGRTDVMSLHVGKLRYVGLAARVVAHEIEHLEGGTMLGRMGALQRQMFMKRMAKAQKKRERAA